MSGHKANGTVNGDARASVTIVTGDKGRGEPLLPLFLLAAPGTNKPMTLVIKYNT